MKRAGLTMVSIVLYVVLFFAFTTFAIAMSSNMDYKIMSEKGNIYVCEQRDKLQANILKSANESDWVEKEETKLKFSNDDIYEYDTEKKIIKKNNGTLVKSVEECNFNFDISTLTNVDITTLDTNREAIAIKVKFLKYGQEKSAEYLFSVGAGTYE